MALDRVNLQALVDDAPFHRWLGISVSFVDERSVELRLPWKPEFSGHSERCYVHGGILSTLIDLAGYYAVAAINAPPTSTLDLHVDFLHAATAVGLLVRGEVEKETRALAWASARVEDVDGNIIAIGRGLYRATKL